jgi:hypothetical protein
LRDNRSRRSRAGRGHTAQFAGFAGLKNGQLLDVAESQGFEVLLTADQNIPAQQNLGGRALSILILCAPTNRLRDLIVLVPSMRKALAEIIRGRLFLRAPTSEAA